MALQKKLEKVTSREELAEWVAQLKNNFIDHPEEWENADIASYLEAISAWLHDMDGYYENQNMPTPSFPTWRMLGDILLASKFYE